MMKNHVGPRHLIQRAQTTMSLILDNQHIFDGHLLLSEELARSFNFTYIYIDDVLSLNNHRFSEYLDKIYPDELEIKDTSDSSNAAAYLDLYLRFVSILMINVMTSNFPSLNFLF